MSKKFLILITIFVAIFAGVLLLKTGSFGTQAVWQISNGGKWLLPLVSVAAIIDSINPCAFSILILTIAFLFTLGRSHSNILKVGAFYILGIFLVYVLIGLGILQTLQFFNVPHFMARLGATLLILWGLVELLNEFFPNFPIKLKIPQASHRTMAQLMEKGSIPTAFGLGALVGLCEFPCTGGPYLMVLGLLHDQATYARGLAYLFYYNLIFILPLIIILLIASDEKFLRRVQQWKTEKSREMRFISSLAMILLGMLIFIL
ncbi:hypothetical protein HZC33_02470 [Candidatus Wolfebacteria bacterium]|nr:hypothetical protein [Candidatus Wolfebacteria bacterium]